MISAHVANQPQLRPTFPASLKNKCLAGKDDLMYQMRRISEMAAEASVVCGDDSGGSFLAVTFLSHSKLDVKATMNFSCRHSIWTYKS